MTLRMEIPEGERGHVRVFAIDLPGDEAATFGEPDGRWPLQEALGAAELDPDHVEVFPVSNLEGVGLSRYLIDGLGMDEGQVAEDAGRLDTLRGHVALLRSPAARGQVLTPRAPLRWVGTYSEPVALPPMERLRADAARGVTTPGAAAPQPVAPRSRVLTRVLLGLAAIVALILLLAL